MQLIAKKTQTSKTLAILTIGALSLTPLLSPLTAQAAPPSHAPAWGYRDKGKDKGRGDWSRNDSDRDDRDRGDWNRGDGYGRNDHDNRNITLRGTVQRDLRGDEFTVRADNGHNYRVISRDEPRHLSDGDRVELRGWIENNTFIAERVQILNNRDWDDRGQRVTLNGTVLNDLRGESFQFRGDDGRTYVVIARNEPQSLSRNDRIRLEGRLDRDGRTIFADNVRITDNRDGGWHGGNGGGWNSPVNFPGRVESANYEGGVTILRVRGDDGRSYTVRYRNGGRFRVGDRVRVVGNYSNGVVIATSVSR